MFDRPERKVGRFGAWPDIFQTNAAAQVVCKRKCAVDQAPTVAAIDADVPPLPLDRECLLAEAGVIDGKADEVVIATCFRNDAVALCFKLADQPAGGIARLLDCFVADDEDILGIRRAACCNQRNQHRGE